MKPLAILGVSLSLALPLESARAQDYAPFSYLFSDGLDAILLNGEIDFRTPLAFRRVIGDHPNTKVVILNSVGGSVQAALLIAEDVYAQGMSTIIPKDGNCASACSFIFFAGQERLADGKLGVHQISGAADQADAQLNLSDILEALNKYGVTQSVITRMLRTPASEIYTFSQAEILQYGINRLQPPHDQDPTPTYIPIPTRREATTTTQTRLAIELVERAITASVLTEKAMVDFSSASYAERVFFFGKVKSLYEVLEEKKNYAQRWPVRDVDIDKNSLSTFCGLSSCMVTGRYDWSVSNPAKNKTLAGSAEFSYEVDIQSMRITSETGKVLSRQ